MLARARVQSCAVLSTRIRISLGPRSSKSTMSPLPVTHLCPLSACQPILVSDSFTTAAEILSRPLQRCVVISNSIFSIEAAKDLQMKCVIISDRFKAWELHEADIIVKDLEELTFQRFQSLFSAETEN